jgi:hypothetical protein
LIIEAGQINDCRPRELYVLGYYRAVLGREMYSGSGLRSCSERSYGAAENGIIRDDHIDSNERLIEVDIIVEVFVDLFIYLDDVGDM